MPNINDLVSLLAPLCVRVQSAVASSLANTTSLEATDGHNNAQFERTYEVPATTFTCFAKLPTEIQQVIWELVALHRRVVEVYYRRTGDNSFPLSARYRSSFPSFTLAPALLHTCSASRAAGLKVYEIFPSSRDIVGCRDTYINWNIDTIIFKNGRDLTTFEVQKSNQDDYYGRSLPPHLHPISLRCRNLALPIRTFLKHAGSIHTLFPNIEELIVVRDEFKGLVSPGPIGLQGNFELIEVKNWEKSERINKTTAYHTKAVKQTIKAKEVFFPLFVDNHPKHPKTSIMNARRDENRIRFRDHAFYESLAEESSYERKLRLARPASAFAIFGMHMM